MFIGYWESKVIHCENEYTKKLGLPIRDSSATISCLGSFNIVSNGEVDLLFTSHFESNLQISIFVFVIEKVTDKIPHVSLPANICYEFNDLRLADPSFHKSANIDILLGVNVFLNLINGEIIKRAPNLPFAMSTKLGWIISGTTNLESSGRESLECKYR
ncbi:retrovirus-related Pol polyprotein from transposon 17.6 [Trichonephila clavata]|uniref:Retrovirus-related Pol polyprotein from transposon 17.6 n=1 Tax=Trichonephila clavata TaxID=2740835 RepID=A0A8X6HQR9_TRICU|nr:retrovirus-related Pol polyprotein from transposon 17.6 [Trichonephila clavata]